MPDKASTVKIFISYRHVEPDQTLASSLSNHLQASGLAVFTDQQIQIGVRWVEEIERQLTESDGLVVLLSKDSIRSDMVRQEVKFAQELARQRGGKFKILPVRVDFRGALPYDLAAYLDPLQYAVWQPGESPEKLAEQLLAAINHSTSLPHSGKTEDEEQSATAIEALADATERTGAPLPSADPRFLLEAGAVRFDSPFYVRRETDAQFEGLIRLRGQTIIIKAPRQFGKSSLLSRADVNAQQNQQQAFYLDFQLIDAQHLESLDKLVRYLARRLTRHFKTQLKPEQLWDDALGAKDNITDFIEEALLVEASSPILFLFDEADCLFDLPFRDAFFATVRGWHNLRARRSCWNFLNIAIAHSTEPHLWIQDITQSPFNVGTPIRLADFDREQIAQLNDRYGKPLQTGGELDALLNLTGGHPFLVRQSFYTLVSNRLSITKLTGEAPSDAGPFGDHLRRFLTLLHKRPELKEALSRILRNGACDDEAHFQRLNAAGLVRGETRNAVQMRCGLYRGYFSKHL